MRRVWLGAALALCVIASTASSLTRVLPPPVVSLSTLTPRSAVVARDSVDVVVAWTKRCDAGGCPTRYRVAIAGEFLTTVARIHTGLRDTLRVPKPVCPITLTVRAAVIADRGASSSAAGAAKLAIRCRAPNVVERAHADSFPKGNHRITLCSKYGHKMSPAEQARARAFNLSRAKTPQDSGRVMNEWEAIRLGPDSVYTPQTHGDSVSVRLGYQYPIAFLVKNRYTGKVRAEEGARWMSSDPTVAEFTPGSVDCREMIAAWEAERDS